VSTTPVRSRLPGDLVPPDDRELQCLIACARPVLSSVDADRLRATLGWGLDWDRLILLAERHGLAPLLYWHASREAASGVPAQALASLRDTFEATHVFNVLLTAELVSLLGALKEAGIEAMPFKGPAIAVALYGRLGLRPFGDLDILVRADDVWAASAVLTARGFIADADIPHDRRAALVRHDYVRMFRRDAGRTLVELHWRVSPRGFGVRFDADGVWRRRQPITLQGEEWRAPSLEDLLLMLCVHGGRHGWDKLEGIATVAEILRRRGDLDWDAVWRRSREMHCRRMLLLAMRLARGLFGVEPPAESLGRPSRHREALAAAVAQDLQADEAASRFSMRQFAVDLRLKDTRIDQLRQCASLVLTPTPEDWAAWRLPPAWSFAYPLVRAVRMARKHTRPSRGTEQP
jgi:hypothetical protein